MLGLGLGLNKQSRMFYRTLTNSAPIFQTGTSDTNSTPINFKDGSPINVARILGVTLKNETTYTPSTWVEWTKDNGIAADSTGLTLVSNGTATLYTTLLINVKPSTNYGFIYNVVSCTSGTFGTTSGGGLPFSNGYLPRSVGNQKVTMTSASSITTNAFKLYIPYTETSGNSIKIKDIRVFELPSGSQIEADFYHLTADQLSFKYPWISGTQSVTNPVLTGTGKNQFDNAKTPDLLNSISLTNAFNGGFTLSNDTGTKRYARFVKQLLPNTTYHIKASSTRTGAGGGGLSILDNTGNTPGNVLLSLIDNLNPDGTFTTSTSGLVAMQFYGSGNTAESETVVFSNIMLNIGSNVLPWEAFASSTQSITATLRSKGTTQDALDHVGDRYILTQRISSVDGSILATPVITDITAQITGSLTAYRGGQISFSNTVVIPQALLKYRI